MFVKIQASNQAQAHNIVSYLLSKGYKHGEFTKSEEETLRAFVPKYLVIKINLSEKRFEGYSAGYFYSGDPITFEDLFNIDELEKKYKVEKVKLNNEYTAEITYKGITVGCQSFGFEVFDELVKAVNKVRKN